MLVDVLRSFADKDTERIWRQERSRQLDQSTQRAALRKLLILDAAETLDDARIPPGNRLEKLRVGVAPGSTASASTSSGGSAPDGAPPDLRTSKSSTNTERTGRDMSADSMAPIHPGEILAEEYLAPLGVTQYKLAVPIGVPPRRINEVVHGTRRISANTALRLARYFGTSERFWMNLQGRYDLEIERDRLAGALDEIKPLASPAVASSV